MRDRIFSVVFFGTLFWLAYDFLFYAGLFVSYIEANGIPVFFNQFFVDLQIWWLWPFAIVLYGAVFMARNKTKQKSIFFLLTFLFALIPWIPSFGDRVGYALFAKENMAYRFNRVKVDNAILLYEGRGYDYVRVPGKRMTLRYRTKNRL